MAVMADAQKGAMYIKRVHPDTSGYVSQRITRTYRRLHRSEKRWTHSLVHNIWYEKLARIDAWAMDSMREEIGRNEREKQDAAQQLQEARAEYKDLRARYHRQKASMDNVDPDFFGPQLDALALKIARFIAPEIEGE